LFKIDFVKQLLIGNNIQQFEKKTVDRWEVGSDLCWTKKLVPGIGFKKPWDKNVCYFGSGRDALRSLIFKGMQSKGWKRLWIPSYFCQIVVGSILTTGIEVMTYRSNPCKPGILPLRRFKKGDIAFIVNFFGLVPSIQNLIEVAGSVEVIEDHSHDLLSDWALKSQADWCIASLRKTIPAPDGGVLWSPRKNKIPDPPPLSNEHYLVATQKQAALAMKSCYLEGGFEHKSSYLELSRLAERSISSDLVSGASPWVESIMKVAPIDRWRSIRRKNYKTLADNLLEISRVKLIRNNLSKNVSPYAVILIYKSKEIAKYIRHKLIQSRIYPAVLWPLDSLKIQDVGSEDISLSERMLSIACDARYDANDMIQVACFLNKFGKSKERNN
jgi:hypothetical protein